MTLNTAPVLAQTTAQDGSAADDSLSMEFLEFLSEWETAPGDWMGPENFEDDSFDQLYEDNSDIEDDESQR